MRHAAPHTVSDRKPRRATQVTLAAVIYAVATLSVCTITLAATLTLWTLWQQLGVN